MDPATILIIEDNLEILENITELLQLHGYIALTASGGRNGIDIALKHRPDMVVCDITMPEMDGYEVLKTLRNYSEIADIPFIFLTSKSEASEIKLGIDMGCTYYMVKPFDVDELLNIVEKVLKENISKAKGDYII